MRDNYQVLCVAILSWWSVLVNNVNDVFCFASEKCPINMVDRETDSSVFTLVDNLNSKDVLNALMRSDVTPYNAPVQAGDHLIIEFENEFRQHSTDHRSVLRRFWSRHLELHLCEYGRYRNFTTASHWFNTSHHQLEVFSSGDRRWNLHYFNRGVWFNWHIRIAAAR